MRLVATSLLFPVRGFRTQLSTCNADMYILSVPDPNTSEEAKHHAQQVLNAAESGNGSDDAVDPTRRAAGFKAALHSEHHQPFEILLSALNALNIVLLDPNVSTEAKEHAREELRNM